MQTNKSVESANENLEAWNAGKRGPINRWKAPMRSQKAEVRQNARDLLVIFFRFTCD